HVPLQPGPDPTRTPTAGGVRPALRCDCRWGQARTAIRRAGYAGAMRRWAIGLAVLGAVSGGGLAAADPSSPAVEQKRQPPGSATAEKEYNRGVRARVAK